MSAAAPLPNSELARRYMRRDGQPVAAMRCFDAGDRVHVECLVGGAEGPRAAGPYVFATPGEALRFMDEATLALSYLGCDIDAT